MTGGRILSIKNQILENENDNFFLTYGDGVSDIDIKKLYKFHIKNKKIATMTIVRPPARWGYVVLKKDLIKNFEEKNQLNEGWINGGFFVLNKKYSNILRNIRIKTQLFLKKIFFLI